MQQPRPNQLWSWDITKLKGPATWSWFHLYVLLDVFSRYVVGWLLAHIVYADVWGAGAPFVAPIKRRLGPLQRCLGASTRPFEADLGGRFFAGPEPRSRPCS